MELNEPVIHALHRRLVDGLPAAIAARNAEITDGITLTEPSAEQILTYIPPPSDLLQPPVIGIGDAPSRLEDDNGSSATGCHELLIVVYEQASDQNTLAWTLRRWTQVIAGIVLAGRQLDGAAWGTRLKGTRPGPTLVDNPDHPREWLSWTGHTNEAKRDEV